MIKEKLHNNMFYIISETNFKETLLFVHSAMTNHHLFDEQFEFFEDKANIVAIDLFDHGQSTKGKLLEIKETINEVLALEQIEQVHAVGIELGAMVVQDFANDYPHKIKSLTCVSSYDIFNLNRNLQQFLDEHNVRNMLKRDSQINKMSNTKEGKEKLKQLFEQFEVKSALVKNDILRLRGQRPKKTRNYPLTIVAGELDHEDLKFASEFWHKSEPDSKYIEIEGASQMVNLDQAEAFNKVLLNSIGENE